MTAKRRVTILLSSAGRRVSLLRSLREAAAAAGYDARVIACDADPTAPALHVADAAFLAPPCAGADFDDFAVDLAARERVDLVVPTIDPELPVWSRLRERLAAVGTTVAVSGPQTVEIAADKRRTHEHCVRNGIPCPRQATPSAVLAGRARWRLPLIVKPARGSGSDGVLRVSDWSQLRHVAGVGGLVVEELVPGVEHTVDVYLDRRGVAHCPVVRRRLAVRAGEVSKAQVVRDARLESVAVKTVESLPDAFGVLNVQVFADGPDVSVIEINARFGGGYPLTWRAGGRYGQWLIQEVLDGTPPPAAPPVEDGLLMLRWDEEVFVAGHAS
ncbi:ATP-grasp domain-containing protein [Luedemannella helvata]|uniref:ATP-grasp domain-containing protein n=1 Tax=Luedemannella helvata TaxID=349315 RepID=A0ABN2L309_9ACTN